MISGKLRIEVASGILHGDILTMAIENLRT